MCVVRRLKSHYTFKFRSQDEPLTDFVWLYRYIYAHKHLKHLKGKASQLFCMNRLAFTPGCVQCVSCKCRCESATHDCSWEKDKVNVYLIFNVLYQRRPAAFYPFFASVNICSKSKGRLRHTVFFSYLLLWLLIPMIMQNNQVPLIGVWT